MRTTSIITVITLGSATLQVRPAAAFYDQCEPDFSQGVTIQASTAGDAVLTMQYCEDFTTFSHLYDALNFGDDQDWWGPKQLVSPGSCNPNTLNARTLNAARQMDVIRWHRGNLTQAFGDYDWLVDYVHPALDQGLEPHCDNPSKVAANDAGLFGVDIYHKFFWTIGPTERASALIHEATHDPAVHPAAENMHISNSACMANASCDSKYNEYNANSTHMNYLLNAVMTYRRSPVTDEAVIMNFGDGTCGYVPVLSGFERYAATNEFLLRFAGGFEEAYAPGYPMQALAFANTGPGSYDGFMFSADTAAGARWSCDEVCDVDEWASKCDPDAQPGNAGINVWNAAACQSFNDDLAGGVTPDEYAQVQALHQAWTSYAEPCIPGYSDAYLAGYCEDLGGQPSATADTIADDWDLDDVPGSFDSGDALLDCQKDFCEAAFDPSWATAAEAACYDWDDSEGCLDEVCGSLDLIAWAWGDDSMQYYQALSCRRQFLEYEGNPVAYAGTDDVCWDSFLDCVTIENYGEWLAAGGGSATCDVDDDWQLVAIAEMPQSVDEVIPFSQKFPDLDLGACWTSYEVCQQADGNAYVVAGGMLEAKVVAPPPAAAEVMPGVIEPAMSPVQQAAQDWAIARSVPGATGTASPETRVALMQILGGDTYFAMFGTTGQDEVFGPSITRQFAAPVVRAPDGARPEVIALFDQAASLAEVRRRLTAPGTREALDAFGRRDLTEAVLPTMVRLQQADSPEELHAVLDTMGVPR